jgi:hypothetical protein
VTSSPFWLVVMLAGCLLFGVWLRGFRQALSLASVPRIGIGRWRAKCAMCGGFIATLACSLVLSSTVGASIAEARLAGEATNQSTATTTPSIVIVDVTSPPTRNVPVPMASRHGHPVPFEYDARHLLRISRSLMATKPGAAAVGSGVELSEAGVPKVIYRQGTPSPSNLTPRASDAGNLSFRDSLSNPVGTGEAPVMNPGKDFIGIDTSKLPPGSVIYDNVPPGHVTVRGVTPEQLKNAVVDRGKFPK